jgi:hypothetical protein
MKRTIITLMAGVAIGAAAVAAPALGSHHATKRYLTMRVGDSLTIPGIDAFCSLWRRDPDGHLTGTLFFCTRSSVSGHSWTMAESPRWIEVGNAQGYVVYKHPRLP